MLYYWQLEMEGMSQLKTQIFPIIYSSGKTSESNTTWAYLINSQYFSLNSLSPVSFKDLGGKKLLSDEYGLFCAVLEV